MNEIAEGVYVAQGFAGGNCGLILTGRGPVLVDTPMLPSQGRQWQAEMQAMGLAQPYAIVNTDYHLEHYMGNAAFVPVRVIGHEESDKPLSRYDEPVLEKMAERYRAQDPALASEIMGLRFQRPQVSVGDRLTLHLGSREIQVLYLEGHTPASLGVYLPKERILFAGDNITNNEHPAAYQANSLAWLDTLKAIREMDIELIIPGTGEPCGKEVIEPLYEYLAEMRRRILELFKQGASRRECVEKVGMLEHFPIAKGQESEAKLRRRQSIERLYTEIRIALRRRH
jgi:cyclase